MGYQGHAKHCPYVFTYSGIETETDTNTKHGYLVIDCMNPTTPKAKTTPLVHKPTPHQRHCWRVNPKTRQRISAL